MRMRDNGRRMGVIHIPTHREMAYQRVPMIIKNQFIGEMYYLIL